MTGPHAKPPKDVQELIDAASERWSDALKALRGAGRQRHRSDDLFPYVAQLTLARSLNTCGAVIFLARAGLGEEAFMLCRSLVEAAISLSYMEAGDSQALAERFVRHEGLVKRKKARVFRKRHSDVLASLDRLEAVDEALPNLEDAGLDFLQRYGRHSAERAGARRPGRKEPGKPPDVQGYEATKRKVRFGTWSGRTWEEMARAAGLQKAYDLCYRLASDLIHHTHLALEPCLRSQEGRYSLLVGPDYEGPHVRPSLSLAALCIDHIAAVWQRAKRSA